MRADNKGLRESRGCRDGEGTWTWRMPRKRSTATVLDQTRAHNLPSWEQDPHKVIIIFFIFIFFFFFFFSPINF